MIVVNFGMFSGLGFGAVADSMIIGLSWIVCSWTSASCREKNLISGGTIDRVGTLTAFAWLLLFEVAFFFGAVWVIWEYCLDGGYGCVGFGTEGVDSGIGSLGKVEMLVIGSGSKLSASGKMMEIGASVTSDNGLFIGATVMGTICGALTTVQVPVLGSLIILLCVTLVIQMLHREVVMDESVCYTSVCLSEEQGQEMKSEALIVLVGEAVMILLVLLVIASLVTVLERKVLGAGQRREGPSWCGWSGLVQIAGDGIKLMMKYVWVSNAGMIGYHREWSRVWIGVSVVFVLVYAGFGMIWISIIVNEISGSVLLVWVLLGIGHLGTVICGTVLSSGWGMLGAYRNLLVWIGYDIVLLLGWIALGSGIMEESEALGLESTLHCEQYGIGMFGWLLLLAWTMGMIMEGGRIPYDMGECESELVSGYVTEYGALGYGLLASAEYGVVVLGSLLWSRMILG